MKGLKNFLYDKNDIVIALVVLLLAGLIIFWRMEVIMAYPQTLAAETDTTQTTESEAVIDESDNQKQNSSADNTSADDSNSAFTNGVLSKEVTVTVSGGSATAAVNSLIGAGLFSSYDEYVEICKAAGYTPENIKAKTFTFEVGSTQTDIAKEVTQ